MNFINKLTYKKSILIFAICVILNFLTSLAYFNFISLPKTISEYKKISQFVLTQISEKDLELTISKEGINLNNQSFLIDTQGFPIELNFKNVIYIAKNSDYSDFKKYETLAILNDKELVLNLNNEYQKFPLNSLNLDSGSIKIDKNFAENTIKRFFEESNGAKTYLFSAFFIEKLISYLALFLWGYLVLFWAVFYTLKFSGYFIEKETVKILTLSYFASYLFIEPLIIYFRIPVQIIGIFFIGYISITFYLKSRLEKHARIETKA